MQLAFDIENYRNYWLCVFMDRERQRIWEYEMYDGHPLDVASIRWFLDNAELTSFNGNNYDMPILALALAGADNQLLKTASDQIIQQRMKPWDIERAYNVRVPEANHIDLIEVAPGMVSLKIYGGRLHSRRMQDLPIEHDAFITPEQRPVLRSYCGNDLHTTWDLRERLQPVIELREAMGKRYGGIDLRSKSDAQISEALFKRLVPNRPAKRAFIPGHRFSFQVPSWVRFSTPLLRNALDAVRRAVFVVKPTGKMEMPDELGAMVLAIGMSKYKMGMGGLHSQESNCYRTQTLTHTLSDHDVTSYYPKLMLNSGVSPEGVGHQFQALFREFYDSRVAAKAAGDKTKADMEKIVLNGTFGKTGSQYSIFYSPEFLIQVTLSGQLAILMLIERLELAGISVVSANTDGIVVFCRRDMHWLRDAIMRQWESETDLGTEHVEYAAIYNESVNSYIALKKTYDKQTGQWTDAISEIKGKGTYADQGIAKNPDCAICVEAVKQYLAYGVPLDDTINQCDDIRQFVVIRRVAGGGYYNGTQVRDGKNKWVEGGEFLGKAVRWYHAAGELRYIMTDKGDKVAGSDGARPLMLLPDVMPPDVDRAHYIAVARKMVLDLGVQLQNS